MLISGRNHVIAKFHMLTYKYSSPTPAILFHISPSMSSLKDNFPPQLAPEAQHTVIRHIQDWSLGNGLVLLTGQSDGSGLPAPVTLFPTPFPKSAFQKALAVQKPYNDIYHEIVNNEEWLLNELTELAKYDPDFTGKLLDIHLKVQKEGVTQPLTGGLFRSDYIVHSKTDTPGGQIKQVEFNTVSVSFGGLSSKLSQLHNYLIDAGVYNLPNDTAPLFEKGSVPISPALSGLASGLTKMHDHYLRSETKLKSSDKVAVLFVVQPGEKNALDQRLLEFELFNRYSIISYRITLDEAEAKLKKSADTPSILTYVPTGAEISVVYYRSGYGPSDYPTDKEWSARYFLESSHAIKCPSVLTQLSGAKKIQQLLTDKSILDKFTTFSSSTYGSIVDDEEDNHIHDEDCTHEVPQSAEEELELDRKNRLKVKETLVRQVYDTFVKIYPLDESPLGIEARKLAFESPEKFVLKPQREGGGNNVYKANIPEFLNSTPKENWGAYILMELIEPAESKNKILRAGELFSGNIVSELGVFGSVLWDTASKKSLANDVPGWLLRTKLETSDEGGVAAGFGCIDSVYLV